MLQKRAHRRGPREIYWEDWLDLEKELSASGYTVVGLGYCSRELCIGGPNRVLDASRGVEIYHVLKHDGPDLHCYIKAAMRPGDYVVVEKVREVCGPNGYGVRYKVLYRLRKDGTLEERTLEKIG